MRFSAPAAWSFLASLACFDVVDAADMLEVDLLFPRGNETYAPMERFPVVFGFRNAELGQYLQPRLDVGLHNSTSEFWQDRTGIEDMASGALTWANWSSHEPYFASVFVNGLTTDTWSLYWTVFWTRCKADSDGVFRGHTTGNESTRFLINFTIKNGAQAVDLVAATAANGKAWANDGLAIGVTDKFVNVTDLLKLSSKPELEKCVVMASSTPTPTGTPCRVTIDSTAAASIAAKRSDRMCYDSHSVVECLR